ncbi:hypothetical protein POF50_003145 [Streptomyces sp. SL13]|uniref:Uncharacterized protein n=1 Tax=Streptantibioticus silvisoli TaxID=2705255 RepID=A0AA90KF01_9ACTN|nr:hypothetical protein [Streptantibioticus silvisoli]MDI5968354.1 hypothetical protein [Streptantibioticus silvisoli]
MDDDPPTRVGTPGGDPAGVRRTPGAAVTAGAAGPDTPAGDAPPQWHRGLTLLATISLFIGTRSAWTTAMANAPVVAGVISVCYAGILTAGVLAFATRSRRGLGRVDLGVLVLAAVLVVCALWLNPAGIDEAALTTQAANEIVHGHAMYGQPWPWLFGTPTVGITKLMSGGADYTYGYGPLTALLVAPIHLFAHSTVAATAVTTGALLAGTVTLWVLLPAPWRSAATAVCLGFGLLPAYARGGYPAITALALLIPVVVRWHRTGAGGRLGRGGVARSVCLGLACAAQQLAWFLAPFLLVGMYAVRRGELGHRRALEVTVRHAALAFATWLLVNAYFIAQGPSQWLSGSLLPFTQKAILHGQGVMGISYYVTGGSDRLDFYSYAGMLLMLGLLAATVLFVRRLGPALTVLPWCAFYLTTRSQDGYFLLMTPLWIAAAATVPASALAGAWQPRPVVAGGRRAGAAVLAALLAPAVLCVGVAAASPPPLRMTIDRLTVAGRGRPTLTGLAVRAVNVTGTALAPHFATRSGQGASDWWTVRSGPAVLRPHARGDYVLRAPADLQPLPTGRDRHVYLIAVSGTPMTITTTALPLADAHHAAGPR